MKEISTNKLRFRSLKNSLHRLEVILTIMQSLEKMNQLIRLQNFLQTEVTNCYQSTEVSRPVLQRDIVRR